MEDIKETFKKLADSIPENTKVNVDAMNQFNKETNELIKSFIEVSEYEI